MKTKYQQNVNAESKHTPGQWVSVGTEIRCDFGLPIAETFQADGGSTSDYINDEEAQANARLIALAPDMLAALQEWRKAWVHIPEECRKHFIVANNKTGAVLARI